MSGDRTITRERFLGGMTIADYVERVGTHVKPEMLETQRYHDVTRVRNAAFGLPETAREPEMFRWVLDHAEVSEPDRQALRSAGRLNVLILTEDWSGDSLYQLPLFFRLVEGLDNVEVRIFLREQNLDLMSRYLNQGVYQSIPVFVFFDEDMKELGHFIERPRAVHEQMERAKFTMWWQMRARHQKEWHQATVTEMRTLLKR